MPLLVVMIIIVVVIIVIIIITTITQIDRCNFFYIPYFNKTCVVVQWNNVSMVSNRDIDGNHKLIQPYRIVICGGLDGFLRMIVFLQASTNNRASTALQHFQSAVEHYNLPSRVRSNLGMENIAVACFMLQERGLSRGSHLTGKSVHNQRREHLWCDVNRVIVRRFLNNFLFLEHGGILDPTDEVHLFCIHLVYIPLINDVINQFISHPVSTQCNFSPNQLWIQEMLHF